MANMNNWRGLLVQPPQHPPNVGLNELPLHGIPIMFYTQHIDHLVASWEKVLRKCL